MMTAWFTAVLQYSCQATAFRGRDSQAILVGHCSRIALKHAGCYNCADMLASLLRHEAPCDMFRLLQETFEPELLTPCSRLRASTPEDPLIEVGQPHDGQAFAATEMPAMQTQYCGIQNGHEPKQAHC